ncbi:hypothetical protein QTN25_009590 [Entamoeba marina]
MSFLTSLTNFTQEFKNEFVEFINLRYGLADSLNFYELRSKSNLRSYKYIYASYFLLLCFLEMFKLEILIPFMLQIYLMEIIPLVLYSILYFIGVPFTASIFKQYPPLLIAIISSLIVGNITSLSYGFFQLITHIITLSISTFGIQAHCFFAITSAEIEFANKKKDSNNSTPREEGEDDVDDEKENIDEKENQQEVNED